MSNLEYKSYLIITYCPSRKSDEKPEIISIPVHYFEVEGGASRKIDLTSTGEFSIATEFEQARIYSNFIFYIPPTKDFLAAKLINLSDTKGKHFNFSFSVSVYSEGKTLRIVLPEKVTDTTEKWNATAWKTDAFYGNPLTGFSIQQTANLYHALPAVSVLLAKSDTDTWSFFNFNRKTIYILQY